MEGINIEAVLKAKEVVLDIKNEIKKAIIGKDEKIDLILTAFLANGHILLEDIPGTGKTTMALSLAKATGLVYNRIQFTPDVMASDITGFSMYQKEKGTFEYKEGAVMCNILLADEINRTSPKTQSSLLEVMEEKKVTVDNVTYEVPNPFMVIATQNPFGYIGTYPLPEAQLDRFLIKMDIGYPNIKDEIRIIKDRKEHSPIKSIENIIDINKLMTIKSLVKEIHIAENIFNYMVSIIHSTRNNKNIQMGASPRASLALMDASRAFALISGRDYVIPEDILYLIPYVLGHRIVLSQEAKLSDMTALEVLKGITLKVKVPLK